MDNETIRIIITGGTFDKSYDAIRGELTFDRSHLPQILKDVRCRVPVELEIHQLVDSLDMGERDRDGIVDACIGASERRIVITHGTDTMVETANRISARFSKIDRTRFDKTIVLTGAMVPYAVSGSDALFNLGTAISAVQLLDAGIYIAMHGQIFPAGTVLKDRSAGLFRHA